MGDDSAFDLEPLLAPDLSNLMWVDVGHFKPNSLFAIVIGPDELMPVTMRTWKPKTSELFLCAWKTAQEIRHILRSGGHIIKHTEILRELDKRNSTTAHF